MPRRIFARRPLYLMVKPPADVAARIHALPRNDRRRGADLLHMTLAAFADLAKAPAGFVDLVARGLDDFGANAFPIGFDRIECRKTTTLRSSAPLAAAWEFQRQLAEYFQHHGFKQFNLPPELHVTINYRGDTLGSEVIAPIEWTAAEILLIESVVGETRHVVHGRWPLPGGEPGYCRAA
ncbi:2'-5' RNA ligase family protein [Sphingopyxis sp.]|jgi:2'-5' RNA ligase|uniref:2'-5' RNA ligase family protein n=1 Tax=Sphingopyxis sp. TaxID=1908224 RepID=UPI003F71BB46